jgi:hypothetical protein
MQLIESGSKQCPNCRAEFQINNPQPNQVPNNRPRPNNSIFNFRWIGGWLPNFSIRVIRGPQRVIIPTAQTLERSKNSQAVYPFIFSERNLPLPVSRLANE